MRKYTHGGDIYDKKLSIKYDFSANINPLGMPVSAKKAILENIDKYEAYPDPFCRELVLKLAEKEGVKEDNIVCGNGAADLLYRLANVIKPKDILVMAPTFSEYERSCNLVGAKVHRYYLNEKFELDEDIFRFIKDIKNLDIIFLCSPNNPTGILIKKEVLKKICEIAEQKNAVVLVDHCFISFVEEAKEYDVTEQIYEMSNLIVLKAFTKIYAMAGLRLGYMISANKQLLDEIFSFSQPWSVSTPAQIAGSIAIERDEFVKRSVEYIKNQRKLLKDALKENGFNVIRSQANYICFSCEDGVLFRKAMEKEGILIRDCSNYFGLDENFSRIAVRTKEENEYFISKLEELKWQK